MKEAEFNEEFQRMMGYPMEDIKGLVETAKEINRNRIVELNKRDLEANGIEND